jgi:hypothetical protein
MYDKTLTRTKKTLSKKKLKIGVKLQKNLDKNKFGLAKNPLINKSLLLINKKVLLFDKKCVEWRGEIGTLPNTTIHIHHLVPHTQRNITKTDMVKNHIHSCYICFPHINNKKKLLAAKKTAQSLTHYTCKRIVIN